MNATATSLITLQNEQILRKPYAGKPPVRFDEEEGAAPPPLLTLLVVQSVYSPVAWLVYFVVIPAHA